MTNPPRDWDKELAEIDRAIERSGGTPAPRAETPAALPPGATAPRAAAAHPAPVARRDALGSWIRVALAVLLAAAMPLWPYDRTCGLGLFLYLGAAGVTVLAGAWAAFWTWRARRGLGHVAALLVIVWGGVLVAREVLPRTGYATASATWACASPVPAR